MLTGVEIIALVLAIVGIIKIFAILINKKVWYENVAIPFYKNAAISRTVLGLITIFLFYYLLKYFTIVEIFAVMALTSSLIALGFMTYAKDFSVVLKTMIANVRMGFPQYIYILIWFILSGWVIYSIFV